jgi:hypothetical protein
MCDAATVWPDVQGSLRVLRVSDGSDLFFVRWRSRLKRFLFVLGLGVGLASAFVAGCYASVSYHPVGWGYWGYGHSSGAFSTSYGSTGIVWNQPQGVPAPHAVVQNDTPVEGSDGTFGWRRSVGNADAEIHRVSALLTKTCRVEKYGYDETQAACPSARVFLRRDDANVYLLCAGGTDRKTCEQAWVSILTTQ